MIESLEKEGFLIKHLIDYGSSYEVYWEGSYIISIYHQNYYPHWVDSYHTETTLFDIVCIRNRRRG